MIPLKEYIELEKIIIKIQKIDWSDPTIRSATAYFVEQSWQDPGYGNIIAKLKTIAGSNDANEFAWQMANLIKAKMYTDKNVDRPMYDAMVYLSDLWEMAYKEGSMDDYGAVNEKYIPDWFFVYDKHDPLVQK